MRLSPAPVRSRMRGARTGTGPRPVRIVRSGRWPWRTSRWRPSSVCLSAWPLRKAATSASTACASRARAPSRRTSVSGSENSAGWISLTILSWVTACHSFGGEVEARTPPRSAASTPHAVTNFRAYLEAGPFQAVPHPGASWQPRDHPAQHPHEYIRGGTTKILTLFQPATRQVRLPPAARGTNAVLHPWLRERLSAILAALPVPTASQEAAATQAAWAVWQAGLMVPFTLPDTLPPLRLLLVWDNLAGHKTPDLVLWLCAHGVRPLYTPVGGSWLNMAESIERGLKRRARDGQHPHSPEAIGCWFEQTARA